MLGLETRLKSIRLDSSEGITSQFIHMETTIKSIRKETDNPEIDNIQGLIDKLDKDY